MNATHEHGTALKRLSAASHWAAMLLFVIAGCSGRTSESSTPKPINDLLPMVQNSSFSVWAAEADRQTAHDVLAALQVNAAQVCTAVQTSCRFDVEIEIYPDQASFDRHVMNPDMRGFFAISGSPYTIQMVSPNNPKPHQISYADGVLVAVHEFVHLALDEINPELPTWLDEGVAIFVGPHEPYTAVCYLAFPIEMAPSFQALQADYDSVQAPDLFAYTAVDFIVHEYGMENLNRLLRAPQEFENILGTSAQTFQESWHRFMANQYRHE
jgi:RNA polymerase sigma-70 factor (ECF subfamily)